MEAALASAVETSLAGRAGKHGIMPINAEDNNVVLIQNLPPAPEAEVRTRFAAFGTVVWCSPVAPGCYLVRYLQRGAVMKAVHGMNGSMWRGAHIQVQPVPFAPMHAAATESLPSRQDSISAVLEPEHLAYLDSILTDETYKQEQQLAPQAVNPAAQFAAQHGMGPHQVAGVLPDLVPCAAEWTPPGGDAAALCHALEGLSSPRSSNGSMTSSGPRASIDSNSYSPRVTGTFDSSGSPAPAASQLWSQKSIGTSARQDLAKFAALQSLAFQHHHSQGLPGSPWGSGTLSQQQSPGAAAVALQQAGVMQQMQRGFELRSATPDSPYSGMGAGASSDMEALMVTEEARSAAAQHWLRAGAGTPAGSDHMAGADARSSYAGSSPSVVGSPSLHQQRLQAPNQWSPAASPRMHPHATASPSGGARTPTHVRAGMLQAQHTPSLLGVQSHTLLNGGGHYSRHASPATSARDSARGEPHGSFPGSYGGVNNPGSNQGRPVPPPPREQQQPQHGMPAFPHQQPSPPPGLRAQGASTIADRAAGSFAAAAASPFATGSCIITELLDLLNHGGADSNPCLLELRDLLNSALAGGQQLDAQAFLGLLQTATASVQAAAAPQGARHGSLGGAVAEGRGLAPLRARAAANSAGGDAPGSTRAGAAGSPLASGSPSHAALAPQTPQELSAARAALLRLMESAHQMITSSAPFAAMCALLVPVADLYDHMHDLPVVQKRRRCQEMALHRERIAKEPAFVKALHQAVTLRNHIYSLSRKVLLGHGAMDGLPLDLFLGGLASELGNILKEPEADGSSSSGTAAVLAPHMAEFYTAMPHPRLALLVFAEFVPVDPQPVGMSSLAAAAGASCGGAGRGGSSRSSSSSSGGAGDAAAGSAAGR